MPITLVVVATLAAAVETAAPSASPTSAPVKDETAVRTTTISPLPMLDLVTLWESDAAREDCVKANSKLFVARAQVGLGPPSEHEQPAICAEARLANLTRGTEVRVEASSASCGDMKRVVVLSGKHEGKKGCVREQDLADPADSPKQ